jgi:tricorn protease
MKRRSVSLFLLFFALNASAALAAVEGRFMEYPDIRGDRIVFTYQDDLWLLSEGCPAAVRLTSHPGSEFAPKISPDGKWVAFSGQYGGATDVYCMPLTGGEPKRLTYCGGAQVVTWTPDGKKIIFRSSFENTFRPITKLYAVSPDGTMSERLPVPRGVLCSFSPDGKQMVYNPRGREEYYWKRYKGGQYQDIRRYDFVKNEFTKITDYVGKNAYPMWVGDRMYYVSDSGPKGIANLYTYDFGSREIRPVTRYEDFDVQMPSTDGRSIVYLHSGFLHVLDTGTEQTQKIDVRIPTDEWTLAARTINPTPYIQSMSISNDGKTAALEARGDIFLVPADEDEDADIRNWTDSAGVRERYPQISPDGKRIAYLSDRSGEYELYVQTLKPKGEPVKLTDGLKTTVYHLEWSPDGKKILFGTKDFDIFIVDVESGRRVLVDSSKQLKNDEFFWEISDYSWSPDSLWVVYSLVQYNHNNQIFLYNLKDEKRFAVTDDFYDNLNPSFDAGGDYLYFLSYRNFGVQMDVFEDNHIIPNPVRVMVVQLKAGQKPLFTKVHAAKPSREETPLEKHIAEEEKEKAAGEKKKAGAEPFRIDLEGIGERVFPLPVEPGNYFYLKAGKGKVTWASTPTFSEEEFDQIFTPGGKDKLKLHVFDMDDEKEAVLKETVSDWRLSINREHMLIKKGEKYFAGTVKEAYSSKDPGEKVDLGTMTYRVEPRAEWAQIFSDTWRWYRDFFYDPEMHGRDWKKIGEMYRAYLPRITSRENLNWLLRQMVGELCVSHTYVGGGDMGPEEPPKTITFTGFLGADLEPSPAGYYRFEVIYGPTDYNRDLKAPLVRPDIDLKEGDYLIAINGREIKAPDNLYKYLQVVEGQRVEITVNREPASEGAKAYKVEPVRSEYDLRYNRWLADNIDKVEKASNGEIGYMHITAMGSGNVAQFDKFWRAFRYKKGLIIDVRGNGGGWTEYFLIDKLERKMVAYDCLRDMIPFRYPGSTSMGHLAVLTNEYNGSDGEAFVEHFKARRLGTVIGTLSWGGLVGIVNAQKTIDNGTVYQSNNAFYNAEMKWVVENHGAEPDITVENDPASVMAGHDKQLETAIDLLLKQIREQPFTFPEKPPYPKK